MGESDKLVSPEIVGFADDKLCHYEKFKRLIG